MMKRSRTVRSGFTLIEVLLVILILGLLAAFVVPQFVGTGEGAKIDIARAAVGRSGSIATALEMFRLHVGRYPTTEEGLMALIEMPDTLESDEQTTQVWRGPYIQDPGSLRDPWGNEYQYRFPGEINDETTYDLWSNGPDGEEGTDDDIGNWTKG